MCTDQGKIFVGGVSWETTEKKLRDHFSQYGDVLQTNIMKDKATFLPRGFGFVLFADPSVVDSVLRDQHTLDGRTVDVKRALSRDEQNTSRVAKGNVGRNMGSGGTVRTNKIFVGGLPLALTEDEFRQYFGSYGHVIDAVILCDQHTQRPRGFGFISFDSEDAVERVLNKAFHDLSGKQVEVKRALPKDANPGMSNRAVGGGGASGGYQSYGSSGGNTNAYDGRVDSKEYVQSQNANAPFGHYASSGYVAPTYGYYANNGMGYSGYGGANSGYGGPGGAYGNLNIANTGYGSGPSGAGRNSWNVQSPSGYASVSYGHPAPWLGRAAAGAGSVSGHSPNGYSGYGNQGYGYGNYGGSDGSYGIQGGYGNMGGRTATSGGNSGGGQMQGSGYTGGGYGDANGHSGYGAPGSYGAQFGGQASYGTGYGGAQSRQAQHL